ncbi:MAG: hypothetical protein IH620_02100, partial [Ignavibacterium sp.]|nr:hypothetical protein [Ignavibacterium sp.]
MDELIQVGVIQEHYNVSYTRILKYSVELFHKGLKEHKIISAPFKEMIENKINLQLLKWSERWTQIQNKQYVYHTKESKTATALHLTKNAENEIDAIENLLKQTLSINDSIDWETIKDSQRFKEKNPAEKLPAILNQIIKPVKQQLKEYPLKPDNNSPKYQVRLSFLDKLFTSRRLKIEQLIQNNFEAALSEWKKNHNEVEKLNQEIN